MFFAARTKLFNVLSRRFVTQQQDGDRHSLDSLNDSIDRIRSCIALSYGELEEKRRNSRLLSTPGMTGPWRKCRAERIQRSTAAATYNRPRVSLLVGAVFGSLHNFWSFLDLIHRPMQSNRRRL